jgi:hypothetical protein
MSKETSIQILVPSPEPESAELSLKAYSVIYFINPDCHLLVAAIPTPENKSKLPLLVETAQPTSALPPTVEVIINGQRFQATQTLPHFGVGLLYFNEAVPPNHPWQAHIGYKNLSSPEKPIQENLFVGPEDQVTIHIRTQPSRPFLHSY